MPQKFDMKAYEANQQRKVHLRKWAAVGMYAQDVLLQILAEGATRSKLFKTCITCNNFEVVESAGGVEETIERCKLVGVRPPARVIADGCEKYTEGFNDDDDIPF